MMDCPNWPPPLPSLPPKPPCRYRTPEPTPPKQPPEEVKIVDSKTREWWDEYLGPVFDKLSDSGRPKKGTNYELTRRQRRELLSCRTPTKQDKLIWSVPLPEGSYPPDGLPIWEKLYLDRKLPMLKCPPDALAFARQKIGKKLWKDTQGQEFILYDPNSYEVAFSYENVHDPHLTTYYQGKEIRGFLLSLGDATEDGWGLCSLKRFNQYRKYLRRVHLSLVHSEMERQEALKNEVHKLKEIRQTTKETMEALERKNMSAEIRYAILEALRQNRLNRINRILAKIQEKEVRIKKLYQKREKEKQLAKAKGLKLLMEQELKNNIAMEIKRRKKIATLRKWHDTEQKIVKTLKKRADEKARQKAEKVRLKWQNKINNLRKMIDMEEEYLKLQSEVKKRNIEIRNAYIEKLKDKEREHFQNIRNLGMKNKALEKRLKEEKQMEKAITEAWLRCNPKSYDLATEIYRVKKSINSTMAELLTAQMEGPDRFSIILMSRNRIQREQEIPLQVSYAIDVMLETTIEVWANVRLLQIVDLIIHKVIENSRKELSKVRAKYKNIGIKSMTNFKASTPYGKILRPDPKDPKKQSKAKQNKGKQKSNEQNSSTEASESEKEIERGTVVHMDSHNHRARTTIIHSYVHYGSSVTHEYPVDFEPEDKLKPVKGRPKTPMPNQKILCEAGFFEERLDDVLPTLSEDVMNLKEKRNFRKIFRKVAVKLYKRAVTITKDALDPGTRYRAISKLMHLEERERVVLGTTLCKLIMNTKETLVFEAEEFEWLAKVIAREAIEEVVNPPEFSKSRDDGVARTKIMFYKPKIKAKPSN